MFQQNLAIGELSEIQVQQKSFFDSSNQEPFQDRLSFNIPSFSAKEQLHNKSHVSHHSEGKLFNNLFDRANDLGYQGLSNTNRTIVLQQAQPNRQSDNKQNNCNNVVFTPSGNSSFSQILQRRIGNHNLKKHLQRKMNEILFLTAELATIKIQIQQSISGIRQKHNSELRQFNAIWMEKMSSIAKGYEQVHIADLKKIQTLQEELRVKENQIQRLSHHNDNGSAQYKEDLYELKHQLEKCNHYISQLEMDNEEMKYQVAKLNEEQRMFRANQQQLNKLNEELQKNSQYIFDLQQKIVDYNYEFIEKERILKKLSEEAFQIQKQKLFHNYQKELDRAKQEMKMKISEQLYCEYQHSIHQLDIENNQQKQRLRKECQQKQLLLSQERQKYQIIINNLNNQKIELRRKIKDWQLNMEEASSNRSKISKVQLPKKSEMILIMQDEISPPQILKGTRGKQKLLHGINSNFIPQQILLRRNPQPYMRQSESSFVLEQEKDIRMRNISNKLLQLRADIRKEIGTIQI